MGLYWRVLNITKRQRFELPNVKDTGLIAVARSGMLAEVLIAWAGDEIRVVNDEGWREDLPDPLGDPDRAMILLYRESSIWPGVNGT